MVLLLSAAQEAVSVHRLKLDIGLSKEFFHELVASGLSRAQTRHDVLEVWQVQVLLQIIKVFPGGDSHVIVFV